MATAYERLGDFASALPQWRSVHAVDPSNTNVALGVARCCVELAQYREALDVLGRMQAASRPGAPTEHGSEPYWLEARAHLGVKDPAAAARVAMRGIPLAPTGEARLDFVAGEAFFELGQFDEANGYLEKATRYSPEHLRAWLLLGHVNCATYAIRHRTPSLRASNVACPEGSGRAPHASQLRASPW
ncbi:MAG: tetratricopeptide repeat protein [Polyangiaceae bacterium]